jgi:hypothetical protein
VMLISARYRMRKPDSRIDGIMLDLMGVAR